MEEIQMEPLLIGVCTFVNLYKPPCSSKTSYQTKIAVKKRVKLCLHMVHCLKRAKLDP